MLSRLFVLLAFMPGVIGAEDYRPGIQDLYRLDLIPRLKDSIRIGCVSSYDRSGGNDDGFSGKYSFVRKDPEGLILADLKGPGVIYRIWTPTPTEDLVEFLFDGEAQPRVSLPYRDLFLGKHAAFPRPLVGFGAGGYYSYVPMPFAKTCVVRLRGPKAQFYQINYAMFPPARQIESFDPPSGVAGRERACAILAKTGSDLSHLVAGERGRVNATSTPVKLSPGSSQTVFSSDQGGRIVGLRCWPAEVFGGKGRDLVLKISYDGEAPAVWCPLGDFFGYAWGRPAMRSMLNGTAGSTNYCYFPMPFDKGVRVELVSERSHPVEFVFETLCADIPRHDDEGKFYALWHRENPTKIGQPFTFLETTGRGHLVGVSLQSQGFESGKTLFFEGDDQTTIDGELAVHGTGSEDFFNGGWYDVPDRWEKRLSFPLSGCLEYAKHLGRTGAYRLFLGDAYSYRRSLRQTIEHAGEGNSIPTDYCSMTWFYSEERPSGVTDLPPVGQRKVNDPVEIVFQAGWQLPIYAWSFNEASLTRQKGKFGKDEVRYLSMIAKGDDWFGPNFISPICDVPVSGEYKISIQAVKGPAQAKVQLFQNENSVGLPVDLYSTEPELSDRLFLGNLSLAEGKNNLMFKLVGKREQSSGLGLNLVSVICTRAE